MASQSPLISVIIPAYNREKYIAQSIFSVLEQSAGKRIEIIVVDDGSSDNTREEVFKLQREAGNIKLLQQTNMGPSAARNAGFRIASGDFIQFLDSDDLLGKGKFDLQLEALSCNPQAGFATCGWSLFDESTDKFKAIFGLNRGPEWSALPGFFHFDFWVNGTPLYRREVCERTGPWREDMRAFEDWEWHIRMALRGARGVHVNQNLMFVRDHAGPRLSKKKLGALEMETYNVYLNIILSHFRESGDGLRRHGNDLASLLYRAAFWNFRAGNMEHGYSFANAAGQICTSAARRRIYKITLAMAGGIGINRSIYLWDRLASLNRVKKMRSLLWGK